MKKISLPLQVSARSLEKLSARLEFAARVTVIGMAIGMACTIVIRKEMDLIENHPERIEALLMQAE